MIDSLLIFSILLLAESDTINRSLVSLRPSAADIRSREPRARCSCSGLIKDIMGVGREGTVALPVALYDFQQSS